MYTYNGSGSETAYDINGHLLFDSWDDEASVETLRNETTGTTYYVVSIPKTRTGGRKQYPFVYCPNGINSATQSTLAMNLQKKFYCAINGGRFLSTTTDAPIGTVIQNSTVIQQGAAENFYQGSQLY